LAGGCRRRPILAGVVSAALLLLIACSTAPLPFLLGGIQVNEPDHAAWMQSLRQAGLNTVSVTVYARQGDWNRDHLWWEESESAVVAEIQAAKQAGLHVVLILRLALDHAFEANRFLWHGMVQPTTAEAVESWFRQYGEFAQRWARVAEQEGVDVLGVASELNELTSTRPLETLPALQEYYLNEEKQAEQRRRILGHGEELARQEVWDRASQPDEPLEAFLDARRQKYADWARAVTFATATGPSLARMNERRRLLEAQWEELIGRVRTAFHGPLTYAANFDQYQEVGFWKHLDLIGINAYFALREEGTEASSPATEEELQEGWGRVLDQIEAFRRREGLEALPVLFTELGYTDRQGSSLEPWASQGFSVRQAPGEEETSLVVWRNQPQALEERALALEGLREALAQRGAAWLQGILYWKLSTLPSHRQIEPFVLILEADSADPALAELQRFAGLQVDPRKAGSPATAPATVPAAGPATVPAAGPAAEDQSR
jgi:hypothetical protein